MTTEPQPVISVSQVEPHSRGRAWGRLGAFLVPVVFALAMVIVASRQMKRPRPTPFDRRAASALKRARPEFVLVGNSMVGTRFDESELRRLLKPRRVTVLGLSGTVS